MVRVSKGWWKTISNITSVISFVTFLHPSHLQWFMNAFCTLFISPNQWEITYIWILKFSFWEHIYIKVHDRTTVRLSPFISVLYVRFASCLKSKIFVMQPWLLSVAVVWSGSARMFCQPRWFLTITWCEWRGCQSRSLKRKQEELKPEEKRRILCPLQCRFEKSKHLMKEKY